MKGIMKAAEHGRAPYQRIADEILIVEDDPVSRLLLKTILTDLGYKIFVSCSVEEGRKIILRHRISIAFLDLIFPVSDSSGFELVKLIKSRQKQCVIIVVTSSLNLRHAIKALRLKVSDYLVKPIRPSDVLSAIDRAISQNVGLTRHAVHSGKSKELLTDKEKQVLNLLSRGFSYDEAASLLNCKLSTIQTHIKRTYKKLDVHSCAEAVFEARQHNILSE